MESGIVSVPSCLICVWGFMYVIGSMVAKAPMVINLNHNVGTVTLINTVASGWWYKLRQHNSCQNTLVTLCSATCLRVDKDKRSWRHPSWNNDGSVKPWHRHIGHGQVVCLLQPPVMFNVCVPCRWWVTSTFSRSQGVLKFWCSVCSVYGSWQLWWRLVLVCSSGVQCCSCWRCRSSIRKWVMYGRVHVHRERTFLLVFRYTYHGNCKCRFSIFTSVCKFLE